MNNKKIKCKNCNSYVFLVDWKNTGYKQTNPKKTITIDGKTEFAWETYLKC